MCIYLIKKKSPAHFHGADSAVYFCFKNINLSVDVIGYQFSVLALAGPSIVWNEYANVLIVVTSQLQRASKWATLAAWIPLMDFTLRGRVVQSLKRYYHLTKDKFMTK